MSTVDNTGELFEIAEALERLKRDPRRPGRLDVTLLSITVGASLVVIVAMVILVFAASTFKVEPGRIVLTLGAVGGCLAPVLGGMYGINRINRTRYRASIEKFSQLTEAVKTLAEARHAAAIGYTSCFQTIEVNLGIIAAQIEQLDQRFAKFEPQDEAPVAAKEIAMRSFETGRRIGRKEAVEAEV